MQVPGPFGASVSTGSASRPAQLLGPNFKFWACKSFLCPASPTYIPTGLNHECHLLAETGLEPSANIFMLFDFRRTGETKHNVLIVNRHLGLKDALTSSFLKIFQLICLVFALWYRKCIHMLTSRIGDGNSLHHSKSVTISSHTPAYSLFSLQTALPQTKFLPSPQFQKGSSEFPQNNCSRHTKYFGENNLTNSVVFRCSYRVYCYLYYVTNQAK